MSDLRTAAQQALEACEQRLPLVGQAAIIDELNNLRAALAQQVEPRNQCGETCERAKLCATCAQALAQQAEPLNLRDPAIQKRLASQWGYVPAAQAEPVEPVAWYQKRGQEVFTWPHPACWGQEDKPWTPLYAAPPQRKPLPKHDQHCVDVPGYGLTAVRLVRAVELAHGIKE